jgi:hypothetical protein
MKSGKRQKQLSRALVNLVLLLLVVVWTIPTWDLHLLLPRPPGYCHLGLVEGVSTP